MQAVLDESAEILRAVDGTLICVTRHGFVCANAGVDQSNASGEDDELVLLPEDPDGSAASLSPGIEAARGVRPAVVIADSFRRAGGSARRTSRSAPPIPLDQWIGRSDAFGRELHVTSIAVADSIAAAAGLARAKDSLEPAGARARARALRHPRGRPGRRRAPPAARAGPFR